MNLRGSPNYIHFVHHVISKCYGAEKFVNRRMSEAMSDIIPIAFEAFVLASWLNVEDETRGDVWNLDPVREKRRKYTQSEDGKNHKWNTEGVALYNRLHGKVQDSREKDKKDNNKFDKKYMDYARSLSKVRKRKRRSSEVRVEVANDLEHVGEDYNWAAL
jgi:hypothetical protein